MKKILMSIVIINALFANEIISNKEIYLKEGKAYFIKDEKIVSGTILAEVDGNFIYSNYENGNKVKERVLNNKRELISEMTIDKNNLINGKVNFTNEYGENIIADVKWNNKWRGQTNILWRIWFWGEIYKWYSPWKNEN